MGFFKGSSPPGSDDEPIVQRDEEGTDDQKKKGYFGRFRKKDYNGSEDEMDVSDEQEDLDLGDGDDNDGEKKGLFSRFRKNKDTVDEEADDQEEEEEEEEEEEVDEISSTEDGEGDGNPEKRGFFGRFRKNKDARDEEADVQEDEEEQEEEDEIDSGIVSTEDVEGDGKPEKKGFFSRFRKNASAPVEEDNFKSVETDSTIDDEKNADVTLDAQSDASVRTSEGEEFGLKDYETVKQRDYRNSPEYKEAQKAKKQRLCLGLILLVAFLLIIGLALGLKLGKNTSKAVAPDDEDTSENAIQDFGTLSPTKYISPTNTPSASITNVPTEITDEPTGEPTEEPTVAPTIEPTVSIYVQLLQTLQQYTDKNTLLDSSTPQGQAFAQLLDEGELEDSFLIDDTSGQIIDMRVRQRYALMVLYGSTSGDSWLYNDGWSTFGEDECRWYGLDDACVQLLDGTMAVTSIQLEFNRLSGDIPSEICALSYQVVDISLSGNELTGTIPSCIGSSFTNLNRLMIAENDFSSGQVFTDESEICSLILDGTLDEIAFDCNIGCDCCGEGIESDNCGDNDFFYLRFPN